MARAGSVDVMNLMITMKDAVGGVVTAYANKFEMSDYAETLG